MAGIERGENKENEAGQRRARPVLITVNKDKNTFGFTLRYVTGHPSGSKSEDIEVNPDDTDKKRLKVSMDPMDTIFVKHVTDAGPASTAGLRQGDRIMSVNGQNISGKSYSKVIALIQASDQSLKLLVLPKEDDGLQRTYGNSAYNTSYRETRGDGATYGQQHEHHPSKHEHHPSKHDSQRAPTTPDASNPWNKPPSATKYKSELRMVPEDGRLAGSHEKLSPSSQQHDIRLAPHRTSVTSIASGSSSGSYVSSRDSSSRHGDFASPQLNPKSVQKREGHPHHSRPSPSAQPHGYQHTPIKVHSGTNARVVSPEHPAYKQFQNLPSSQMQNPPLPARTSSRNITLRYGEHSTGSLDSISRSSDSSANSHENHPHRAQNMPPNVPQSQTLPFYVPPNVKRSLDNLDSDVSHSVDMGNLNRKRSRSGDRAGHRDKRDGATGVHQPRRSRGNRATEELRRKFFENGLTPQGGPVYGTQPVYSSEPHTHSLSTPALHNPRQATAARNVASHVSSYSRPITTSQPDIASQREHTTRHTSRNPYSTLHQSIDLQALPAHKLQPNDEQARSQSSSDNYGFTVSFTSVADTPTSVHDGIWDHSTPVSHSSPFYHQPQQRLSLQEPSDVNLVTARKKIFESDSNLDDQSDTSSQGYINTPNRQSNLSPRNQFSVTTSLGNSPYKYGSNSVTSKTAFYERIERSNDSLTSGSALSQSLTDSQNLQLTPSSKIPFYFRSDTSPSRFEKSPDRQLRNESQPSGSNASRDGVQQRRRSRSQSTEREKSPKPGVKAGLDGDMAVRTGYDGVRLRSTLTTSEEDRDNKLMRRTSYLMATRQPAISVDASEDQTNSSQTETPQQRPKNIKKLKAFFGERTPKIVEAQKAIIEAPASPLGDVILEGLLNYKISMTDGKRASDRSWKPMWCVLRGHALCLYKDRASVSTLFFEEQPISVKSSIVDIAHDYTKRRNVLRLGTYNGSEYLLQADTHEEMLRWIQAIQAHNNPDQDVRHGRGAAVETGVSSQELISRKIHNKVQSEAPVLSQGQLKKAKPPKSLRAKSPATQSPAPKHKKQASKDDHSNESPKANKEKDSKTWKGKIGNKFKRSGSSSVATMSENSDICDANASFGVLLKYCPPSSFSETVPFVVEVCTKFVEAHGLENQGIYRVPGNTGAINMLQHELDKGPDNVDFDNEKWLDVNVVSSLLKSFFRKLAEPLITEELYDLMIAANRIENPEKRMLKMKKMLHDLPEHHFDTFQYLAQHLYKVHQNQDKNRMDVRNLAIVFGPTLVRTTDDSMLTMVKDMSDQCRIIESIVSYPQWFFGSWDEDVYVPVDQRPHVVAPISGMNLQLIHRVEHMQLGERGKDFSAKDLVSSVFNAANKKIRRRDKTKGESIDIDFESEASYQERNIDAEIETRIGRVATECASMVAGTTTGHAVAMTTATSAQRLDESGKCKQSQTAQHSKHSYSMKSAVVSQTSTHRQDIYNAKLAYMQGPDTTGRVTDTAVRATDSASNRAVDIPVRNTELNRGMDSTRTEYAHRPTDTTQRTDSDVAVDVKRYKKYPSPDLKSYSPGSESQPINPRYTPSPGTSVTSLQNAQSDAGCERDSTERIREHVRRRQQDTQALRLKQEQEARENRQRALARHKIEVELVKARQDLEQEEELDFIKSTDPVSYRYSDYLRSKMLDNSSLVSENNTSDYSTSSSNTNTLDSKASLRSPNYSSDYSSQPSPANSRQNSQVLRLGNSNSRQNSQIMRQENVTSRNLLRQDNVGSPMSGKFFVMSTIPSPHLDRRTAHDDSELNRQASPRGTKPNNPFDVTKVVGNSTLQRREKDPKGHSVRPLKNSGSRSERFGGSLDSLIDSKCDQLNSSFLDSDSEHGELFQSLVSDFDRRLNDLKDGNETSPRPRSKTIDSPRSKKSRPDSVLLTIGGEKHLVPRELVDKFRDPSLHRVIPPKGSDPQIGIAYRFERTDTEPPLKFQPNIKSSYFVPSPKLSPGGDSKTVAFSETDGTRNSSTLSPHPDVYRHAKHGAQTKYNTGNKNHSHDLSPSSSQKSSSPERDLMRVLPLQKFTPKPRAPSPVILRQRDPHARKKREHRRHTVAGIDNSEHMQALASLMSSSNTTNNDVKAMQSSAWERLQPASNHAARDLQTWLQEERLRQARSTSDLLDLQYDEQKKEWRYHGSEQTLKTHTDAKRPGSFDFFQHARTFSPSEQRARRRMRSIDSPAVSPTSPLASFPVALPGSTPHNNKLVKDTKRRSRAGTFTFESSI